MSPQFSGPIFKLHALTPRPHIVVVACALLLLGLASAWLIARQWVRPLYAVQQASARIARGEFDVRLKGRQQGEGRSDEIGDLVRNLNLMAEGLQRLEGARRRWLADISHELRTPLAVLRGEIEALVDGVRPLRPEAIVSLREDALRLSKLVDDLHLLAMSDLQTLPCRFEQLNAVQLLRQMIQRYQARFDGKGLEIRFLEQPESSLLVQWDSVRIEQLLSNLFENSMR